MTIEDDLDTLYGVPPPEFTALRGQLVAQAKKRGETDAARTIGAARRPTVAAWVVNALVRADPAAADRLAELRAQLQAAHAAMDGARIRELTAAQRRVVTDLTRAGLAAARVDSPTPALRADITNTLQAAIADPGVHARLGRLEKAEEWSGFGDFGVSMAVGAGRPDTDDPDTDDPAPRGPDGGQRRRVLVERRGAAAAALAQSEKVHAAATGTVADRQAALVAARQRLEQARELLAAAEHDVDIAAADLADARHADHVAKSDVERDAAALAAADAALDALI
ncbi:hypothetical protein SAMN04488581_3895 [Mycolicibacterium neoaurum]|uniref:hypothetical protein n=1 Tax=Mycolicibacterium neoaurum TaxID=1795 RepID=UPI00088139F9|nr:hypothetical protein [Mycolicibacterium neoaurum]SDE33570.1 hypothetical protein SAMN04488581_3895 [Mycolicibacterium neoaurum]